MAEYIQGTGTTLDFDLSGTQVYEQPSGSTLDFELSGAATLLQLEEVVGVADVDDFLQQLFRSFTEQVTLNDLRTVLFRTGLTEDVAVSELSSKQIRKLFSETLTVQKLQSDNAGFIAGTVDVDGSPVQGANVYIVKSGAGEFKGADLTDSGGDYRIGRVVDDGARYLVAVDFDGASDYGLQKSVEVNFN